MLAVALSLAASLAWGFSDFIGGISSRRMQVLTVLVVSQIVGLTVIAAVVLVRGEGGPDTESAVFAALAAAGGLGGLAAFYRGLAVGAMAVVAPISATAAAIPVVFGAITGESPSGLQYVGMVLAIGGVVLASREEHETEEGERSTRRAAGTGLAVLAALGIGFFFVTIDQASENDAMWAILLNRMAGVTLLLGVAAAMRPNLRVGRGDLRLLIAIGVLDMAANTLFALASNEGLVGVVSVLASLYPVIVIALARVVLGERVRPSQQAGAGLALAGVALISAG